MSYINQPTINFEFLRVEEIEFDVIGGSIDGGRNGNGDSPTIDIAGGGKVTASYENCWVHEPEQFEYVGWLGARLNNSVRFINAVLVTDRFGLFSAEGPFVSGIPHSDGSLFSDGAGYSQATVFGTFAADAAVGAGQVTINVFGAARNLRWSDWFSVYHSVKGWRAYRYWECSDPTDVTETVEGFEVTGKQYTIGLAHPLRQAVTAGMRIEFARPRFVAKFPVGFTLPTRAKGYWLSRPTIRLVEAY